MVRIANPYTSHPALRVTCNVLRFMLGAVFVFSGFVKAIDPLGVVFKLAEYAEMSGIAVAEPSRLLLWAAMLLSLFEFVAGVCIIFGAWRRTTLTALLVFMLLMTPLTLYLAVANPITDCGCFGEAVKLTNWQTFAKNVVLLAIVVFLLVRRHYKTLFPLIRRTWHWMVIVFAIASMYFFMRANLRHLPAVDFRPYRIGTNLEEATTMPDSLSAPVFETFFILEKDGKKRTFSLEDYPDSSWTFVGSRSVLKKKGYIPPLHDFELTDEEGTDITARLFEPGYAFLAVIRDLRSDDMLDVLNDLYDFALLHGYPFYALTSGTDADIKRWREQTGALYEFCHLDDVTLKTIIRSDPGVLLIKDGTIVNKWSRHDIPRDGQLTDALDRQPWAEKTREQVRHRYAKVAVWMFFPYLLLILLSYLMHRNPSETAKNRRGHIEKEKKRIEKEKKFLKKEPFATDNKTKHTYNP